MFTRGISSIPLNRDGKLNAIQPKDYASYSKLDRGIRNLKIQNILKNICNKSHINLLFGSPVKLFSSPAVALQNLSSPSACQEKAESHALVVTKLCFPIVFNIECKLRCHYFPTFWWRAVWLFALVWLWWMIQLHIGLITKCKQSAKLNLQIEWQCLLDKY